MSSSIGSITPIEIIVPVAVGFTALILTPVAALSLFIDARCIRQSDTDWNPNPFLWGVLGSSLSA
ncbi:hypothetical protein [Halocatena marina]|uniref:Uncharacterized protein n=1 Tax=Halocatena marina TaxID=2934937 RepID=A0ABD5YWS4_9EURY|nr:hypothetical protein [Halocatena marina]